MWNCCISDSPSCRMYTCVTIRYSSGFIGIFTRQTSNYTSWDAIRCLVHLIWCNSDRFCQTTAFRHVPRYSEHIHRVTVRQGGRAATSRRTAEQHVARIWGRERLPCLLPMQAAAGRTPTLLAFTLEQCPSWPRKRALGSPAAGFVAEHDDLGGGRYFIYRPPQGT